MKKILTLCLTILVFLQNSVFFVSHEVFAVTDSYDFSTSTDYTISDTNDTYIHGGAAKLKGSLSHRGHLENGPGATDGATNLVVDGGYAYVTGYGAHAVTSIDISNPSSMSHAGYLGANGTRRLYGAYDLKKVGNFVYVASYISDSLEVIDATDPTNLKHEGRRTNITETKLNGARGIDVVGNYAYIAAYTDNALQIIDISNPAVPVETGYIQDNVRLNGATSVRVVGDYAYVTSYINDSLQIIDVTDPTTPVFVGQLIDDAVTELNGAWGIEVVGNYAYITAYNDDGFEIVDISDPTNPTHVGEIQNSDPSVRLNGAREIKIKGNYAYITAHVDDSIEVIDISVPATPTHAGFYDTDNFGILDGIFGIDISGTDVFVTSYNNASVMSFDITAPTIPVFDSELKAGPARLGNPIGVLVDGDYAYLASYGGHSLEILDISDSANPTHVGAISDHSTNNELWGAWDIIKKGDYIYVSAYGDRGLETIDVSDPTNPISTSTIVDSGTIELQNPRGSYIQGNYLYIVSYYGDSLQIFDISAPATPVAKGFYKDNSVFSTPNDVVVKGNYAFVSDYIGDKIVVIDISDPDNPVYETEIADGGALELNGAWDLRVDGNFLYIAAYIDNAVVIIDISDPTNPVYRGDLDDDGTMRLNRPRGIVYDEGYAYLSTYSDDSVVAFDVSDPDEPLYIDEIRDTNLYDTSTKIDKKDNDLFFTQYLGSSLSVVRESYPTTSPYIIPDNPINSDYFNALNTTLGAYNQGNVTYQLSKDNGTTWYYFDGTSWVTTTGGTANSNTETVINTNIAGFNALGGTDQIKWKAFLNSDGTQKVEIDQIEIDYFDNVAPVVDSVWPSENLLIPKHNFDIDFTYFDVDGAYGSGSVTENNGGSGVDTSGVTDFTNNIAPDATITNTPATTWGTPPHPASIVNGVKTTTNPLDDEYHSDTTNAFIEFNWDSSWKIGDMKIYNRTQCCNGRLTNATIKLYDSSNTLLYTHTLGSTSGVNVIDIDFQALGQVHDVAKLRLDSVGADSYINIREIEIFPIGERIKLFKWDGTAWGDDIANDYIDFGSSTFGTGAATYPTTNMPYGKYKMDFTIQDNNGNTAPTDSTIFYIDEPEFIVSTPQIDLGDLSDGVSNFSDIVTLTVKTVGAGFNITMNQTTDLLYGSGIINPWNGTTGVGFEPAPFTSSISTIATDQNIATQTGAINTNGDKNTYTYEFKIGALINNLQTAGDYSGDLDFGIELDY